MVLEWETDAAKTETGQKYSNIFRNIETEPELQVVLESSCQKTMEENDPRYNVSHFNLLVLVEICWQH